MQYSVLIKITQRDSPSTFLQVSGNALSLIFLSTFLSSIRSSQRHHVLSLISFNLFLPCPSVQVSGRLSLTSLSTFLSSIRSSQRQVVSDLSVNLSLIHPFKSAAPYCVSDLSSNLSPPFIRTCQLSPNSERDFSMPCAVKSSLNRFAFLSSIRTSQRHYMFMSLFFFILYIYFIPGSFIHSHSYSTSIHLHSPGPLSNFTLLFAQRETLPGCRAEIRIRACRTAAELRCAPTELRCNTPVLICNFYPTNSC
jgi:hypothetical protein